MFMLAQMDTRNKEIGRKNRKTGREKQKSGRKVILQALFEEDRSKYCAFAALELRFEEITLFWKWI